MAIAVTALTSGSAAAGASPATASFTPTKYRLVLAAIYSVPALLGGNAPQPTLSGNGLTWGVILSVPGNETSDKSRLTVFQALGTAPTAGAATFSYGGDSQDKHIWSVAEMADVDVGSPPGSTQAVRNSGSDTATGAPPPTVTLPAFERPANVAYGVGAWNNAGGLNPGTGFTSIHDFTGQALSFVSQWAVNEPTVDFGGSGVLGATISIAAEIREQIAPPVELMVLQAVNRASSF